MNSHVLIGHSIIKNIKQVPQYKSMENMNFTLPCRLCRADSIGSGNGYCYFHLKQQIRNHYLIKYPVSGKDLLSVDHASESYCKEN